MKNVLGFLFVIGLDDLEFLESLINFYVNATFLHLNCSIIKIY